MFRIFLSLLLAAQIVLLGTMVVSAHEEEPLGTSTYAFDYSLLPDELNGTRPPSTYDDCWVAYHTIMQAPVAARFMGWTSPDNDEAMGFFTRWHRECPDILKYFRTLEDQLHALAIVQCESGFRVSANDENWRHLTGGRPQGLWSFMTHLNWPERLGFPWLDVYDTSDASFLAAYMVYEGVNPKVASPNFYWWWSCSHHARRFYQAMGIHAPEAYYCPPGSYWQNVPAGSGEAAKARCT